MGLPRVGNGDCRARDVRDAMGANKGCERIHEGVC
jgi:hypothetical protein